MLSYCQIWLAGAMRTGKLYRVREFHSHASNVFTLRLEENLLCSFETVICNEKNPIPTRVRQDLVSGLAMQVVLCLTGYKRRVFHARCGQDWVQCGNSS